jgi:hypothetical protein
MTINLPRAAIGAFFGLMSIHHFGWNMKPGSDAELICDGIILLIAALSVEVKT